MCAVHTGVVLSRAMSVTVLSFSRSYTSPTGRAPFGFGAPTIKWRPPMPILIGAEVVSNTVMLAASPETLSKRKGEVG